MKKTEIAKDGLCYSIGIADNYCVNTHVRLDTIYPASSEDETGKTSGHLPANGTAAIRHLQILAGQLAAGHPVFYYPEEIRSIIYTTNAIESLNNTLKKTIKKRASFPNDEAAVKLFYLSLRNIQKKWTMPHKVLRQGIKPVRYSL